LWQNFFCIVDPDKIFGALFFMRFCHATSKPNKNNSNVTKILFYILTSITNEKVQHSKGSGSTEKTHSVPEEKIHSNSHKNSACVIFLNFQFLFLFFIPFYNVPKNLNRFNAAHSHCKVVFLHKRCCFNAAHSLL
jgi:hypothetical protein